LPATIGLSEPATGLSILPNRRRALTSAENTGFFATNPVFMFKLHEKDTWTLQLDPLHKNCAAWNCTRIVLGCRHYLQIPEIDVSACKALT
jgi:hypothetical protein